MTGRPQPGTYTAGNPGQWLDAETFWRPAAAHRPRPRTGAATEILLLDGIVSALDPELGGRGVGNHLAAGAGSDDHVVVFHEIDVVRDVARQVPRMDAGRAIESNRRPNCFPTRGKSDRGCSSVDSGGELIFHGGPRCLGR
jgi:hypothetical protein